MLPSSMREAFEAPLLFFPQRQLRGTPAHLGLRYEDVWLTASDGVRTHAWFVRGGPDVDASAATDSTADQPSDSSGAASGRDETQAPASADPGSERPDAPIRLRIVMFHGNGGNISVRLDQYLTMIRRWGNVDLLTVEYRGYGLSEGSPSEAGIARDAEAAWEWMTARNARDGGSYATVLFGRSLGGAVATRLAMTARPRPDAVITECAPSSIPYLAEQHPAWRNLHLGRMILNRFDTESYVREVQSPLLVLHSEHDEIVPLDCSTRIMTAANEPKRFQLLPGAQHNGADLHVPEVYHAAMEGFLREFVGWVPGGSAE